MRIRSNRTFSHALLCSLFGITPVMAISGCASDPAGETSLVSREEAIVGGCSDTTVGAPCDPDGFGAKTECEGICTYQDATVKCVAATDATKNNGKVCESAFGAQCSKTCQAGKCADVKAADGAACKTGFTASLCSGSCLAGACKDIPTIERCRTNTRGDCSLDYCDVLKAKSCLSTPLVKDTACDDGVSCTQNDRCDGAGKCTGSPVGKGVACNDSNTCTNTDQCDGAGKCVGILRTCDDGNPCTVDVCDPTTSSGCRSTPKVCPTDVCNPGSCNATTGACESKPVGCPSTDPCLIGKCDVTKGGCVFSPNPACSDAGVPDTGVDTGVVDTGIGPSDTGVTPTDTGVTPADTSVTPADTGVVPADTTPADTSVSVDTSTDAATTDTGVTVDDTAGDTGTSIDDSGVTTDSRPLDDVGFVDTGFLPDSGDETGLAEDPGLELKSGCGCETPGEKSTSHSSPRAMWSLFGLTALGAWFARRRRSAA